MVDTEPISVRSDDAESEAAHATRVGGVLVGIGAAGVVVITGLYAAASTITSTPLPRGLPLVEAVAEGRVRIGLFRTAGVIGLIADVLLIAGCALLARQSAVPRRLFWTWLGLGTLVFVGVDGLAATALSDVLTSPGALPDGFVALRALYDLCFAYGVLVLAACLFAGAAVSDWPRWVRAVCLVAGAAGTAAFLLHAIASISLGPVFGAVVGVAGVIGVHVGLAEARSSVVPTLAGLTPRAGAAGS